MVWAVEISEPTPNDSTPLKVLPSQKVPPTGDEAFKQMSFMGTSFKLPQAAFRHILIPLGDSGGGGRDKGFCSQINFFSFCPQSTREAEIKLKSESRVKLFYLDPDAQVRTNLIFRI